MGNGERDHPVLKMGNGAWWFGRPMQKSIGPRGTCAHHRLHHSPQGTMEGNISLDPQTAHAHKVYHEILSKLDLSGRATYLANHAETLRTRVDSLREDIVSF